MSDDATQSGWGSYMPPLPEDPWAGAPAGGAGAAPAYPEQAPPYERYAPWYPQYPQYAPSLPPTARATSGWAIASLICSLAGILPILPLIGSLLGVVFGHVALGRIKRSAGRVDGRGLAIAGLILGYLVLGLAALCGGLLLAGWLAFSHAGTQ